MERLTMEDRTFTTAAPAPTGTTTISNHPPNIIREEGELSASENDEFAGSQLSDSTTGAPLNKAVNIVKSGISSLTHNPARTAGTSRTSVHLNNRKVTEKNRVPFVISFSDESGSDSEEYRKGNTIESEEVAHGVAENRIFPTSLVNSQMVQETANTNIKIPKKLSTSRTFAPPMNRVNDTKSKTGGTHSKKSTPPSKLKVGQNIHINSNKLQDLRQLIAIRENELKSKAGKLVKDVASRSLKNDKKLKINAVRGRDSTKSVLVESKEPESKRLKVSEPPRNAVVSVVQHDMPPSESTLASRIIASVGQHDKPPAELTLAAEIYALEIDGPKGRYGVDYGDKEILGGTKQPSTVQQIKEARNHEIPSMNLPSGSDVIRNTKHNKITNFAESSTPLMVKTNQTPPPIQESLNNSSLWNHFGDTNIPETGEMDITSLLEIEDLQDKELDEAQEYRRKCEIEERNALKAYYKAQRALSEANTRCSYLYHKREVFSANLRSRVMEESSMYWSNIPHQNLHTKANVNSTTNMSENNMPHHQVQNEFLLRSSDEIEHVRKNVMSESCGEPDSSGSEPQEEENMNDDCASLHEHDNTLAEDEQTSAFELKTGDSSHGEEMNNGSITPVPTEDSLLLEATLRSQLFARLGVRSSKKNESCQSVDPATVEKEEGEIMEDSENLPSSEAEKDQRYDFQEIGRSKESIYEHRMGTNHGSSLAESILRSAFSHVKLTDMINSRESHTDDIFNEKRVIDDVCGAQPMDLVSNSKTCSLLETNATEFGSYSNNLTINPFWPLCMFELRGKCNDDECPMQHIKDYSSKSIDCNSSDSTVSKCPGSLPSVPPTYLVSLDSLKADSRPYKYLVTQTFEQRWQKYFSASLVVSSSILADLNSDEPCLHGPETRIEVHGVWNRQSSYFHGKNVKEGPPDQQMDDIYQPLEIALLNLSREVNKQTGRREALIILARALEEHPTSVLIWIVYLHIYYSNQKSIGKDDLFRYAIENNKSSFELWLMFINSRENLNDRLLGYNRAISALCRHSSAPERNPDFDSDCILDLFLQLLSCLCSSGQVNDAIQKAYTLLSSTKTSSDLDKSLTIPAKSILWICCMYLILYKKLPNTIVQQFECRKELSAIEWDSVQLTSDEKLQAVALMELATDYIDTKSGKHFALNHIKCTAVLQGFESCKSLLKKYIQLFPSCLELVLLSIRVNEFDSVNATYAAFEEIISNWVGDSGIQCIWNQYAEYALHNGKVNFAKEIMERWFHSISDIHHSKTINISAWISSSTQTDIVFGLLNLSLQKHLQNDHTEARIAVEQVLEVASSDNYNHSVKEHATFLLKNSFGLGFGKASVNSFLNMINRYLIDSRALSPPELLSRNFIKNIGKPKTQKLVNILLCPVSSDSSVLNLVLESVFGPNLLPLQDPEKVSDIVDLAECLMEIRPANYRLALEICKMQSDANASIRFWASSQLIDSLFQAVPVAPESVWVESAGLLKGAMGFKSVLESFHRKALSVYPFSLKLWKSYIGLYDNDTNQANAVCKMASEKGLKLGF